MFIETKIPLSSGVYLPMLKIPFSAVDISVYLPIVRSGRKCKINYTPTIQGDRLSLFTRHAQH